MCDYTGISTSCSSDSIPSLAESSSLDVVTFIAPNSLAEQRGARRASLVPLATHVCWIRAEGERLHRNGGVRQQRGVELCHDDAVYVTVFLLLWCSWICGLCRMLNFVLFLVYVHAYSIRSS